MDECHRSLLQCTHLVLCEAFQTLCTLRRNIFGILLVPQAQVLFTDNSQTLRAVAARSRSYQRNATRTLLVNSLNRHAFLHRPVSISARPSYRHGTARRTLGERYTVDVSSAEGRFIASSPLTTASHSLRACSLVVFGNDTVSTPS